MGGELVQGSCPDGLKKCHGSTRTRIAACRSWLRQCDRSKDYSLGRTFPSLHKVASYHFRKVQGPYLGLQFTEEICIAATRYYLYTE